jgi:hypothetical protein
MKSPLGASGTLREYPEPAGVTRIRRNLKGNTAMNTHPSLHDAPDHPARAGGRSRHPGRLRRATLAAAVLAGAGGLTLAASGIAFATVDQTSPQWAQLGSYAATANQARQVTAVYTIQNVAEQGTEMLEDNNNSMAANTTIDVWSRLYQGTDQDPMATGSDPQITQANYLWEYVPDNPAHGGSIVDGYGELINRQSGLCLDDDGSPNQEADGATITQYGCNGATYQQWTAKKIGSSYQVLAEVDNGGGALGVGNGSTCSTQGNGDSVYVRTSGLSGNFCDQWTIQQASYDFATASVTVDGERTANDTASYACLTGDAMRWHDINTAYENPDYANLGGSDVTPTLFTDYSSQPNLVSGLSYGNGSQDTESGQIMLYCDPTTTTP